MGLLPQIYPDPELEQQILSLPIRCIHSEEGCRWTGQMKQLQVGSSHLLPLTFSCGSEPDMWVSGLTCRHVSFRGTSPPAPSTWYRVPTAAPSSWRAETCLTTCSTTAQSARSSASSAAASSREKLLRYSFQTCLFFVFLCLSSAWASCKQPAVLTSDSWLHKVHLCRNQ